MKKIQWLFLLLFPMMVAGQNYGYFPSSLTECTTINFPVSISSISANPIGWVASVDTFANNELIVFVSVTDPDWSSQIPGSVTYSDTLQLSPLSPGIYFVTYIYDYCIINGGCSGPVYYDTITVLPVCFCLPGFTAPSAPVCDTDTIKFALTDTAMASSVWKVDGVIVSSDSVLNYSFGSPGTYAVSMIGQSNGINGLCTDSATQMVTVVTCCEKSPDIITSTDSTCIGDVFLFSTPDTGFLTYTWKTNGIVFGTDSTASHIFTQSGNQEVTLIVGDGVCLDSAKKVIHLTCCDMDATIANSPAKGCIGLPFELEPANPKPIDYTWRVNGLLYGTDSVQKFSLFNIADHVIMLTADNGLCSVSSEHSIEINGYPGLAEIRDTPWDCTLSPYNSGEFRFFASDSLGNHDVSYSPMPAGSYWQEGFIRTSIGPPPYYDLKLIYEYYIEGLEPGIYDITITNKETGCSSLNRKAEVRSKYEQETNFSYSNPLQVNSLVIFQDLSTGIKAWEWDFGDNSPIDTSQNPSHIFLIPGAYEVCLVTTGDPSDCLDTMCTTLQIEGISSNISPELSSLTILPNPATTHISLDLSSWSGHEVDIEVIDIAGRIVLNKQLQANNLVDIDISQLAIGIYSVLVEIDGKFLVGRLKKE